MHSCICIYRSRYRYRCCSLNRRCCVIICYTKICVFIFIHCTFCNIHDAESCICWCKTMLLGIQTNNLFFLWNTKSNCHIDYFEDNCHCYNCPSKNCYYTKKLCSEKSESTAVEQTFQCAFRRICCCKKTNCDCSPDTITTMNCYGTNRVIYMHYIITEPNAKYYKNSCNCSNDQCS